MKSLSNKKTTFILILLFPLICFSQEIDWVISGGGWVNETVAAIHSDSNGNVIVTGYTEEIDFMPGITLDENGVYVIKFDVNGNVIWHYSFGKNAQLQVTDLVVDSDNSIYVLGQHYYDLEGEGLNIPQGSTTKKTYLIKLNASGNVVWSNSYRGDDYPGTFLPGGLAIDENNNLYLAGLFNSPITINGQLYLPNGGNPFYSSTIMLIKVSSTGNETWVTIGGNSYSNVLDDIAAHDDKVYLMGTSNADELTFGSTVFNNPYDYKSAYIVSFDDDGNPDWLTTVTESSKSEGQSLTVDDEGSIVGLIQSYNFQAEVNQNSVFKILETGELLFVQEIDSEEVVSNYYYDLFYPSKIDADGTDIYITDGFKENFELGPISFESDSKQTGILKLSSIGFPQWLKTFSGDKHDLGKAIHVKDNKLYFAGVFRSLNLDTGIGNLTNNSGNSNTDVYFSSGLDTTESFCPDFSQTSIGYVGDEFICPSDSIEIFVDADFTWTFQWYFNGNLIDTATNKSIYINEVGFYYCHFNQDLDCPGSTDTLYLDLEINSPDISIVEIDTVDFGEDNSTCDTIFTIIPTLDSSSSSFLWNTGDTTSTLEVKDTSEYWLEITSIYGCLDRDTIQVDFLAHPEINLGNDTSITSYNNIILDPGAQTENSTYLWDDLSTMPTRIVTEADLNQGENEFFVTVTDEFGCSSNDTIQICLCSSIQAFVFFDTNNNGIKDDDEVLNLDAVLTLQPIATQVNTSSTEGSIFLAPPGEYELILEQDTLWELSTGLDTFTIDLSSVESVDSVYFGLVPIGSIQEMYTSVYAPATRCSEPVTIDISSKNIGNINSTGTIWFTAGPILEDPVFIDIPDTITPLNIYGWHFENLTASYLISKSITFIVPGVPDIALGDSLSMSSHVTYNSDTISNDFIYYSQINCAYDPNDKLVNPARGGSYTFFGEDLLYTIRFQNTGNDYAKNIVIRDTLDENLDFSSYELISSSHMELLNVVREDDKFMSFHFNNIFLPDSMTNFDKSQGYVSFRITPLEDLDESTEIKNSASIYFDFNPPIITNTTKNILVSELPTCAVFDIIPSSIYCDNGGTQSDGSDDKIVFTINPTGIGLEGIYNVSSTDNPVSPSQASFGENNQFNIPAGQGDSKILLSSNTDDTCQTIFIIKDTGTCSPVCDITNIKFEDMITCFDNNTPTDASDDFIQFDLIAEGLNLGSGFQLSVMGGIIEPASGEYDVLSKYLLQNGSAGGGDWTIAVKDQENDACLYEFLLPDPGSCSVTSILNTDKKVNLIIIPTLTQGEFKTTLEGESADKSGEIFVRNLTGQLLFQDNWQNMQIVNLPTLPSQTLIVEIRVNNNIYIRKIILI